MADTILRCPHCDGKIKPAIFLRPAAGRQAGGRDPGRHTFQHTVNDITYTRTPPKNWLFSLVYFLRGHTWQPESEPTESTVTIKAEIIAPTEKTIFLDRLDSRITLPELWAVARVIMWQKKRWSRANLVRPAGPLTQPKFYIFCEDFKRLNFNFVKPNNYVSMTPKGDAFLSAVLQKYPTQPTGTHRRQTDNLSSRYEHIDT